MFGNNIFYRYISFCDRCRKHKGSGFDLVRDNGIFTSVQLRYTFDTNHIGSGTFNFCPHTVKEIRQIYHMGFFGRILNGCFAFRHGRRHHYINSSAYGYHIQIYMAAMQIFRIRNYHPMLNADIRTEGTKTFDVLVYRAQTDIAASRKGYLCLFIFSKQCP